MVDRLLSLTLENFRTLDGLRTIPLDAEVVLIHGNNASGKSSILYAIELALTGDVGDLKLFRQDYPRCLCSVHAEDGPTSVSVEYLTKSGPRTSTASVSKDGLAISFQRSLKEEAVASFVERCFLSQVRLSRLLEMYQTIEKGQTETPLISFVKKLLNLNLLDNLTDALHDTDDRRRFRNAYPRIKELEEVEQRNTKRHLELREEIARLEADQAERVRSTRDCLSTLGIAIRTDEWDLENLAKIKRHIVGDSTTESKMTRLRILEQSQATLRSIKSLLFLTNSDPADKIKALETDLEETKKQLSEISESLRPSLTVLYNRLVMTDQKIVLPDKDSSPDYQVNVFVDTARRLKIEAQVNLEARRSLVSELEKTQKQFELLDAAAIGASQELSKLTDALPGNVELLLKALNDAEDERCPVCLRDFAETKQGQLKQFLGKRISALGEQAKTTQVVSAKVRELESQKVTILRRLESLRQQDETLLNLSTLEKQESQFIEIENETQRLKSSATQWTTLQTRENEINSQLLSARSNYDQVLKAQIDLAEIEKQLKITTVESATFNKRVETVSVELGLQIELERDRNDMLKKAVSLIEEVMLGLSKRDRLDTEWLNINSAIKQATSARQRVDALMRDGKALLKSSVDAKRKLLESVFNDKLNKVWIELFERLVPDEIFHPRLSEPSSRRDQIKTTISAFSAGVDPFENLGAIHSLGNLNTAALSLFLSLNLVQPSQMPVLVLDDPVQSMDDVHIAQLSLLLREIVHQTGRQIVVAVHERPLFEFLAFELSPAREGEKLITVDLCRRLEKAGISIDVKTHDWQPDSVKIPLEDSRRSAS